MPLREDFIHFHARIALSNAGWYLLAGEYPNGSDDELPTLRILDPALARDRSPEHRRHAFNKLVPDLVAVRAETVAVIEMKPTYDAGDEAKLVYIRDHRLEDFNRALTLLLPDRGFHKAASDYRFLPVLAMSDASRINRRPDFSYIFVSPDGSAVLDLNENPIAPGWEEP